ncbi:unnamed protein product [Oikopleura dioica]|uniref:Uncharacterized protein n=1 Tax=Oikopleura dioica TaxID=34765 RepID=E4XCA4_OIKDI|nr:unnamed protein product [Oikopleura dioica]
MATDFNMHDFSHPRFKYAIRRPREGLQMPKGNVNIVHDELIWKDYIKNQNKSLATWERNWGFTKDLYSNMQKEINGEKVIKDLKPPPKTTSGVYGSRQPSKLSLKLEHQRVPKKSIHKTLKWPVDGCY